MMKNLQGFLSASSIHGLRYLSDSNGVAVRIAWLVSIVLAFTLCGLIVSKGLQEDAENPVTSSISSLPAQLLEFPTVTVRPKDLEPHSAVLVEKVLNFFVFDCTGAGFASKDRHEMEECVQKSQRVRQAFALLIYLNVDVMEKVFLELNTKTKIEEYRLHYLARNNLCQNPIAFRHLKPLQLALKNFVGLDYYNETMVEELKTISLRAYLYPIENAVRKAAEEVKQAWPDTVKNQGKITCKNNVETMNSKLLKYLLSMIFAFGHPEWKVHLGSYIRHLNPLNSRVRYENYNGIENLILTITMEQLNMSRSFLGHKNKVDILDEKYFNKNAFIVGQKDHDDILSLRFLATEELSNNIQLRIFFRGIAEKVAKEVGLNSDVLLPLDERMPPSIMWHCQHQKRHLPSCFPFQHAHSKDGLSFTFNQMSWQQMLKSPTPLANQYDLTRSNYSPLNGATEITFFMQYDNNIILAIHEKGTLPKTGHEEYQAANGHLHMVYFNQDKTTANDNMASLSKEQRKCHIPRVDDFHSGVFNFYSYENCKTDVKLEETIGNFNCLPLTMPFGKDKTLPMCHVLNGTNTAFLNSLEQNDFSQAIDDQGCVVECASTSFSHITRNIMFNPFKECEKLDTHFKANNKSFSWPHLSLSMAHYHKFFDSVNNLRHPCRSLMANTAVFNVKPGQEKVNVVNMRRRVSFSSQLAYFGKKTSS